MFVTKLNDGGWQKFETMPEGNPIGATVHRTRPSDHGYADTAPGVLDLFSKQEDCKKVAKGAIPFHIVIEPTGHTVQAAPLTQKLWHASKLNSTHLGICCVGDFREADMPLPQRAALVGVCVGLVSQSEGRISVDEIIGHTERPEGSAHPEWDSPGKKFDMHALRHDVAAGLRLPDRAVASTFAWNAQEFAAKN